MQNLKLNVFETIFTQSLTPIIITDADVSVGCRVIFANPAFYEMTGYSEEEIIGYNLSKLQGPDTDRETINRLKESIKNGNCFIGTTTNYKKDGTPYIVHWNISPVKNEDGTITNFISTQQDVSELATQNNKNEILIKALNYVNKPIIIIDSSFEIIFSNNSFQIIRNQLNKTQDFIKDKLKDCILNNKKICNLNIESQISDTKISHLELNISPIYDKDQKITHYIILLKDNRKRKRIITYGKP